jgi:hypothetical protein
MLIYLTFFLKNLHKIKQDRFHLPLELPRNYTDRQLAGGRWDSKMGFRAISDNWRVV